MAFSVYNSCRGNGGGVLGIKKILMYLKVNRQLCWRGYRLGRGKDIDMTAIQEIEGK